MSVLMNGGDSEGFLKTDYYSIMLEDNVGYNYTKVKQNVHADSFSPMTMVLIFVTIGLVISCCCVICCCIALNGSSGVADLFKEDGAQQDINNFNS